MDGTLPRTAVADSDIEAFGARLAAWAETLSERDRLILREIVYRAAGGGHGDEVHGHGVMDNITEPGVPPGSHDRPAGATLNLSGLNFSSLLPVLTWQPPHRP